MAKRMFLMLAVVAIVIVSLGYFKSRQLQAAAQSHAFQPPPEAITTIVAKQETWPRNPFAMCESWLGAMGLCSYAAVSRTFFQSVESVSSDFVNSKSWSLCT